jgi:hypothetical protein
MSAPDRGIAGGIIAFGRTGALVNGVRYGLAGTGTVISGTLIPGSGGVGTVFGDTTRGRAGQLVGAATQ